MATQVTNIILYSATLLCSILQISVSIFVLYLMISHRTTIREHRINYLLYANTYIASLFVAIFFIDMCAYSIYGQIYNDTSFYGWWCTIKAYFMYVNGVAFFHTFALQAIYRLCRILYRTRVRFKSFCFHVILSVGLWILVIFELLPSLLIGDIQYIHNDHHCQFSSTNLRGSITVCCVGFLLPFSLTVFCYVWTMFYIGKQTAALININQQARNRRDLLILKRLAILLTVVTLVAAPHAYFPIVYVTTGYLPPWITSLEWILTSLAVLSVSIVLVFVSPHLKKLWTRQNNMHPVMRKTQAVGQ